jgi:hypothetical protein
VTVIVKVRSLVTVGAVKVVCPFSSVVCVTPLKVTDASSMAVVVPSRIAVTVKVFPSSTVVESVLASIIQDVTMMTSSMVLFSSPTSMLMFPVEVGSTENETNPSASDTPF